MVDIIILPDTISSNMPLGPEQRSEFLSGEKVEISVEPGYPALWFSPVAWFDHQLEDMYMVFEKDEADLIDSYGTSDPEAIERLRYKAISDWAQELHKATEAIANFGYYGSSNALIELQETNVAWNQLGLLRQRMIQHGHRPDLRIVFSERRDLTPNAQRLFSIIKNGHQSEQDLHTLVTAPNTSFDLEAAKTELRTWGFLDEREGYLGLTDHKDLAGSRLRI